MLKRVMPHELSVTEITHYYRAVDTDEHSGGVELVSFGIYNKHLQLWTWTTDTSSMVVITEVKHLPDGFNQLLVSMLAGEGGINSWSDCTTAFAGSPCTEFNCAEVIGYVKYDLWSMFKEYPGVGDGIEEIYVVGRKKAINIEG
jgi:hypothetical protein